MIFRNYFSWLKHFYILAELNFAVQRFARFCGSQNNFNFTKIRETAVKISVNNLLALLDY